MQKLISEIVSFVLVTQNEFDYCSEMMNDSLLSYLVIV